MATAKQILAWVESSPPIDVVLAPGCAIALAALVRLALQHPGIDNGPRRVGAEFIDGIRSRMPAEMQDLLDTADLTRSRFPLASKPSEN